MLLYLIVIPIFYSYHLIFQESFVLLLKEFNFHPLRWQVSFAGNSLTDLETVQTYLLYRSAELTLQQGFDYFVIVDRNVDETTRFQSTGFGRASPFAYEYYHPAWGWRTYREPFYNDIDLREVNRYRAFAEIIMGRGPKPADPKAYSAEDVVFNLGPQVRAAPMPGRY